MKVYQSRWNVFRRWCKRRDTSAYAMNIPLLLRFFRYLFEKREMRYITVVGYRASLRDFMLALELPIVKHPLLTCLFSHYHRNVPKRSNPIAPRWCLSLVLNYLKSDIYELLEKASLRALTAKTTFLVCFALAARTSELQGLVGQVCFGKYATSARLTYDDRFWLKMENTLREVKRELRIPALSDITSEPEELLLCPVRALRAYCRKMRELDANRSKLFASPLQSSKGHVEERLNPLTKAANYGSSQILKSARQFPTGNHYQFQAKRDTGSVLVSLISFNKQHGGHSRHLHLERKLYFCLSLPKEKSIGML